MDIERLIKEDLRETVATYLKKYSVTLDQKLGLTRDDLMNDIREQVWKGLLTHNPKGKANLKTYLNTLIKNRFGVLFKRSKIKKNNMINYYADVFSSDGIEEDYGITEETGETVFMRRQMIRDDLKRLGPEDRLVYESLLLGSRLEDMMKQHNMPRTTIVAAINRIDTMIKRRRRGDE